MEKTKSECSHLTELTKKECEDQVAVALSQAAEIRSKMQEQCDVTNTSMTALLASLEEIKASCEIAKTTAADGFASYGNSETGESEIVKNLYNDAVEETAKEDPALTEAQRYDADVEAQAYAKNRDEVELHDEQTISMDGAPAAAETWDEI